MDKENSLKALKDKLNKIPDEILEQLNVGVHEDNHLTLVWEDEINPSLDEYYKWEEKHPELKQISDFFMSSEKLIDVKEEAFEEYDERYLEFKS